MKKFIFSYNVNKNSIYYKALRYHEKKQHNSIVFKPAFSLDGFYLSDMIAIFKPETTERYESLATYLDKKNNIITNYTKN